LYHPAQLTPLSIILQRQLQKTEGTLRANQESAATSSEACAQAETKLSQAKAAAEAAERIANERKEEIR